ncbi:helix-turn-helix domain-containing protein [Bathymodiolus thermophilus thioautotrophic gill symbiont]|nr:helix-turn-helix transcriptional regulator [Bathymodiolus thermophilus thioautotrophic gill symbiont]
MKDFTTKFNLILKNEDMTPTKMSEISGITRTAASDYKIGRSIPSVQNLIKIINAFPKYTLYILDLDTRELPQQTFLKN